MMQENGLTEVENEFVHVFIQNLPPHIARKQIEKALAGLL